MSEGKAFEEKVEKDLKGSPYHYKRLKTRISGFKNDNEIADFYVMVDGVLIYLETKSSKGKTLPFGMIRTNQLTGIYKAHQYKDVTGGVLLETRETNEVFFVPITFIDKTLQEKKRSISYKVLTTSKEVWRVDNLQETLKGVMQWKKHL